MSRNNDLFGVLGASIIALAACGCGNGARDIPRDRLGALPYPGLFTLYACADPARLGEHRYDRAPRIFQTDESERGILYTTEAGFLDLAHVRMAIDWTQYCTRRTQEAIEQGKSQYSLHGANGALFHVTLQYPPGWPEPLDEHEELVRELSIRTGAQLAYQMLTWHELVTWFGHRNVALLDESPSAFSYDDVMSHVVGLEVADRALRDPCRPFDQAATTALHDMLESLGAVSPKYTRQAVYSVEGVWWQNGKPLKRQLDVGLDSGEVRPWLVQGLEFSPDAAPASFTLPSLRGIHGQDFSSFYVAEIEPRIPEADRMRLFLPDRPLCFRTDRDIPRLLEVTRAQMRAQLAPDFDTPPEVLRAFDGRRAPTSRPLVAARGEGRTMNATR